ncbi:MAG: Lrp/AsnC ligand binding domain-containing protein [Nitrososphaerota archaeon]|nr:Lrp/AsnC ligand binding domain-containing protein [Nitrososphaerota archaeon]
MERAIVLVNLSPGTEEGSIASLKKTPGIAAVYQTYGIYDLLVLVEGPDEQAVKAVITEKLRANPGVLSTITMKVVA